MCIYCKYDGLKKQLQELQEVIRTLRSERDSMVCEIQWLRENEAKHYENTQALCETVEPYIEEGDRGYLFHAVIQRILNRLSSRLNEAEYDANAARQLSRELSEVVSLYQHDGDERYILPKRAVRVINRLANSIIAMRRSLGHALDVSKLSVPQ